MQPMTVRKDRAREVVVIDADEPDGNTRRTVRVNPVFGASCPAD
jgi:hypothetical protein